MTRPRTRDDRIRRMLKRAVSNATERYGKGGLEKTRCKPKPITLRRFDEKREP
jgi:hypothetical protein